MQQARIIRKYKNRKLYDTTNSRYVTLGEIALLLKQGIDIKVLDHQSEEDLTGTVLSEILCDQEKNHQSIVSLGTLNNLIRAKGSTAYEFMKRFIVISLGEDGDRNLEAQRYIESLIDRTVLTPTEGKSLLRELQQSEKAAADELERQIGGVVEGRISRSPGLDRLQERLDRLASAAEQLEKKLG
ncbi:MAG: hypothetical protein A2284_07655 [Deltaproteobacteria bacterium RIFOXYA12_FULL_61_11]|nr:MAG: hypothetical protein A2284_07655 [Deltaproteobacteria bacterium RIFOXYA12_FULL_61_11]